MTLFPEWEEDSRRLLSCPGSEGAVIGLHLTLTDFAPLSGVGDLAPEGRLPPLRSLITRSRTGGRLESAIHMELDAKPDAFIKAVGHAPHYIDGLHNMQFTAPVSHCHTKKFALFTIGRGC